MKKIPLESVKSIPQHALRKLAKVDIATVEEFLKRTSNPKERILLERHTNIKHDAMFGVIVEANELIPSKPSPKAIQVESKAAEFEILRPEDLPDFAA